jgi:hypothetical protein
VCSGHCPPPPLLSTAQRFNLPCCVPCGGLCVCVCGAGAGAGPKGAPRPYTDPLFAWAHLGGRLAQPEEAGPAGAGTFAGAGVGPDEMHRCASV